MGIRLLARAIEEPLRQIVENAGEDAAVVLNAASVAGLLLTTEVMIADAPKDEAEHAHMPPGGGMGEMGM